MKSTFLTNCLILIIALSLSEQIKCLPKGTKTVDRTTSNCNSSSSTSCAAVPKAPIAFGTKNNNSVKLEFNLDNNSNRQPTQSNQPHTTRHVTPANDSDVNSQIAYVNLAQVRNESDNNTTKSVDVIQLTKAEATLACGETNKNGQSSLDNHDASIANKIVGGKNVEPGECPFQVRLNIRSRRGTSMCGGVIIDKRHILTAAHCTTTCSSFFGSTNTVDYNAIVATIGDHKINSQDGEQTIKIISVKAHQRYSACSYSHNNYDISILKTAKPMDWVFTKIGYGSINRICLPKDNTNYKVGDNVTVSGWGVTSEGGEGGISNTLKSATVPIVSLDDCKQTYGRRVNDNHICAGVKEGGTDSCQGDSGGPLFRQVDGQTELVGIVSFGFGCARESSPGVYTKVANYIDWIKSNL